MALAPPPLDHDPDVNENIQQSLPYEYFKCVVNSLHYQ